MALIIDKKTRIIDLTVEEFLELQASNVKPIQNSKIQSSPDYVYGLMGIRELFNCSHTYAQKLKNTILAPACQQVGRKIIVDRKKAIELFNDNQ